LIIVGDKDYQFRLSKLGYSFNGYLSPDYLQGQGFERINELVEHSNKISEELKVVK